MDFQPVDHYAQGKGYWEQSQGWYSWFRWPLNFKTVRYYREGRVWQQTGRDMLKYPAFTNYHGAECVGVARGILQTALERQGIRGDRVNHEIWAVARLILMGRRVTQFGVQSTRVADAFSQWESAAFFRRVQTGDADAGRSFNCNSAWSPSISIWIEGVIAPVREHLLELLVATVNLVIELFELWMCWLDIEDAQQFEDGTLRQYALYLAPVHIWEAGQNASEVVQWGVDKGVVDSLTAVVHGDQRA